MIIRPISDLHLEWSYYHLPELPEDKDSVVVIAGDIAAWKHGLGYDRTKYMIKDISSRVKAVVIVCGNHEFYHRGDVVTLRNVMRAAYNSLGLSNVHVLEDSSVVIDDVAFIGATLWTDYQNGDPVNKVLATQYMADYRQITFGDRFITPNDMYVTHQTSRRYIFDETKKFNEQGLKTVIVTHHAVTEQSVHEKYKGDPYNYNFYSELTEDIIDANPMLMIHGHVHDPFDYMVDPDRCQTRVVVNPRGYVPHEDNGHNPYLQVEI